MPREILVHLNVEVADDDPRTADEIADLVIGNLGGVGSPQKEAKPIGGSLRGTTIVCPLAEEIR